jgi:hypothetical protein
LFSYLKRYSYANQTIKFSPFHAVLDGKQSPPYVDPNTTPGYDQHPISFQPPPVTPHASFPKGKYKMAL